MESFSQDTLNIALVDSISYNLYNLNKWDELEEFGRNALKKDIKFVNLRLRLGYGNFVTKNYSKALEQYENVLDEDKNNSTALYYRYLCNSYLNRTELSHYYARSLNDDSKIIHSEKPMSLINQIETEEVYKYTTTSLRNTGMFYNIGLTTALNWNLSLSQSFLYYNQKILFPDIYSGTKEIGINEKQYYGKLSYVPFDNVVIKTAYHYLNLNFDTSKYTTDIEYFALKYYSGYLDFQCSFSYGKFINEIQRQFSIQAGFYPFGNVNLYYILACINSNRNSQNIINVSNTLGFKVFDYLWIEGNYTSNDIFNYLENDILYVYNSLDQGIYKISGTLISPVTSNINIKLGFLYEPKKLAFTKEDTYILKSIYGGLSWKL